MSRINTKILSFGDVQKSLQEIEKELNLLSESVNSPAETNIEDSQGKTGDVKIIKNPDKTYTFKVRSSEGWQSPIFDHDSMTNFVSNEHIDWTTDQGSTNIHTSNYVAGGTSEFTLAGDTGSSQTISNTNTLTIEGGEGIDTVAGATDKVTVSGEDASTSNKGIAIFSSNNFAVSSGTVTIKDEGVALAELAHIATDSFLGRTTSSTGDVEVLSQSDALAVLGVEAGATADQTQADINGLAITTVGTIDSGTWEGTAINQTYLVGQSGTNTGDNATNSQYSGLVSNATHTGDVTGATSLTIANDVALGGNPTTTTQSAGNNSTKIATTAFVSTAVSNLVDSSPDALNTLNELAAALGDDASFSTTVTNSIATKAPLASPTFTGTIAIPNIANLETAVSNNTSKVTNVSTALSVGTNNTTELSITSDGGADDVTLPVATTSLTGVMNSAMFDKLDAISGTNTGDQTVAYTSAISAGNDGLVPSAGTSGHFLAHNGAFAQVAYSNLSGTPTIPANYVTNDADDTMAGTLTIDKDSTATTNGFTFGMNIDYDHTGITGGGQQITNIGLNVDMLNNSVTHVGTHRNYGITSAVRSNTTGTSTVYGIASYASIADTVYGIYNNTTGAGTTGYGIYQENDDGDIDYIQVSSANTADYFKMSTTTNGATTLQTVDADAQLAHLTIQPDGKLLMEMNPMDGEDDAWAITNNDVNMMTFKTEGGAENTLTIYEPNDASDKFYIEVGADGSTSIDTVDVAGADAHLKIQPDGNLTLSPISGIMKFYDGNNASDYSQFSVGTHGSLTVATVDAAADAAHLTLAPNGDLLLQPTSELIKIPGDTKLTFGETSANDHIYADPDAGEIYIAMNDSDVLSFYDDKVQASVQLETKEIMVTEAASAVADRAGKGQIWVKNDTPNNLYFRDDTGQDVAITNNGSLAGGGGGTDTWSAQWSMRWYTRYGWYYYPSSTYGANYYNWNSATAGALTSWNDSYNPCIVVPKDMTIKSYYLHANFTATNTYVLCIKKGTPSYGSAGNTSLSTLGSEQTLVVGTANIYVKMEETGLSVSLSAGDIIIPTLRRTTNTSSSSYSFCEGVLNIIGEYT